VSDAQVSTAEASRTWVKPTARITAEPAETRTAEEIDKAEATMRPAGPELLVAPFKPTMGASSYQAAKKAAAAARPARPSISEPAPLEPPVLKGVNFNGVAAGTSCQPFFACAPPDTHGAVGLNHFVELTNSRISIYTKAGTLVKGVSLNSFFGVPTTTTVLFDPRVVYDRTWNRWVITADSVNQSSTEQFFFIAVSKTGNPTGAFFKYSVDMDVSDNFSFFDYPQLGLDQDAVIFTGNVFDSSDVFQYAEMFSVAKAKLYNGLPFDVALFTGLDGTLAPPIVLDDNSNTFLIAAPAGGTTITKYTLTNSSRDLPELSSSTITVAAYSIPPNASQPGTTSVLDTLDARFVNASTQLVNSLWNVHTIDNGGVPTPRFYEFDTDADTVIQTGEFFASGTSHDFNASIAVNDLSEAFVTWSSTDVTNNINARVMFSGRQSGDALGSMNAAPGGTVLFTSPTFYNDFTCPFCRWGDYSAVTLDPKAYSITGGTCDAGRRAWIVNEKINSQTKWGSRIGRIGFC
jgi:hypothetical protein